MAAKAQFTRGAWHLVIHHNGKRRLKKAGSEDAAKALAKEANRRLAANDLGVLVDAGKTLATLAAGWLEANGERWKGCTLAFYTGNFERQIKPHLGHLPVGAITKTTCRDWLTTLKNLSVNAKTRMAALATLRACLSQAVDDELLKGNPAFRLGKYAKVGDEIPKEIEPFTREEVERLLDAAQTTAPEWYEFLLMACRAGLRLGELLALEWDRLDLKAGTARLKRSYTRGKFTSLKSKHQRTVDLSPMLVEALRSLRVAQKKAALKAGTRPPTLVFPGSEGDTVRDSFNFRKRQWKRIQRAAELKRRRIHDCRHTFASLLLSDGAPVTYVKEQMGHSSIKVTVDVYGKFLPTGGRAWVASLDRAAAAEAAVSR